MSFKNEFVWGVATSSYQIEGATMEEGRGLSIWDTYSREPGRTMDGHTGDGACEHYYRYKQDVSLMGELGVNAYRFSTAWPRILPEGIGAVNPPGLQFYSNLVDALLEKKITPYLTLYHWDLPYALYQKGGWLNPDSPRWFADYALVVAKSLGDRVKHYMTFNEPQVFIGMGFVEGTTAPGHRFSNRETLQMAHNVMLAHGLAAQAIRSVVPDAKIGYAPTSDPALPVSNSAKDIEAARRAYFEMPRDGSWHWNIAWWSDPVMLGEYPEDGLRLLEADLPKIGSGDMKTICQPLDFYGQNIYRGRPISATPQGWKEEGCSIGGPRNAMGWRIQYDCLYWGSRFLWERYQKPIYITENGMAGLDWVHLDGKVHDPQRIDYLARHLGGLKKAAEDGVEVAGYFQWSFMDNYEWTSGYNQRFGIVYLDYETQQRIPKDSFYWYQDTIAKNGENL